MQALVLDHQFLYLADPAIMKVWMAVWKEEKAEVLLDEMAGNDHFEISREFSMRC
jgi:hypothetical protein